MEALLLKMSEALKNYKDLEALFAYASVKYEGIRLRDLSNGKESSANKRTL